MFEKGRQDGEGCLRIDSADLYIENTALRGSQCQEIQDAATVCCAPLIPDTDLNLEILQCLDKYCCGTCV